MMSKREQLKQATQQRIIDAAGQLFREYGFAETTIREIAETSGVSVGRVMVVGDKNDLLIHVFDEMIATEHAKRADSIVQANAAARSTCSDRLLVLVGPFVTLFTANPVLARCYASILVSGTHESILFTELAARLNEEFHAAITLHGCTTPVAAAPKARALYFAYIGTLFTWSAKNSSEAAELLSSLGATFATICNCKE
ncbi:TetR/AcrR family transcriptional regulator [Leucobacter triazinivorans]|uniref:TetR/AcrR family transcriptional regulator n=1 Tax=Leucobacter triazinivorans TaxID=1784719 RepID=A0A4P6KE71_9MICO|nr:TetR/AcrR family transcriptional regulator [Leucobacter triazinivorans]QBE48241.1 TetR/AcrR family transcriptional regulator [Leucobacter triazinivorans]